MCRTNKVHLKTVVAGVSRLLMLCMQERWCRQLEEVVYMGREKKHAREDSPEFIYANTRFHNHCTGPFPDLQPLSHGTIV